MDDFRYTGPNMFRDEVRTRIGEPVPDRYEGMLPVIETFLSIEGEGVRTGQPVVFVRFAGCNLSCSYCDTPYSHAITGLDVKMYTDEKLTKEIVNYNCRAVTFTGGEPLFKGEYIHWFINRFPDYEVNIETNGSVPVEDFMYDNSIITMDYKCPSSGMEKYMLRENLRKLREKDVLKFVVGDEEDLRKVSELLQTYMIKCKVYMSPVFGQIELPRLAQYVIDNRHYNLNMGLQIHKFIWDPEKRGV